MDQQWHNVLHNSMRQPWLYFCYRFDASVVNSLTLLIPYGSYHSVFIDDFKVCSDSVFADDLWISSDIVFLTIPCVSYDFIFAIGLMRRSWIHLRYGFHTSAVTQFWMMISCPTATQFSLTIYGSVITWHFGQFDSSAITLILLSIWSVGREFSDAVDSTRQLSLCFQWGFQGLQDSVFAYYFWISSDIAFLTIPCVSHDSIFAIDLMRRSWIHFRCRFHTLVVTQFSVKISRSRVTLFSLTIYGSAVT
jgi:hypothetical protein